MPAYMPLYHCNEGSPEQQSKYHVESNNSVKNSEEGQSIQHPFETLHGDTD